MPDETATATIAPAVEAPPSPETPAAPSAPADSNGGASATVQEDFDKQFSDLDESPAAPEAPAPAAEPAPEKEKPAPEPKPDEKPAPKPAPTKPEHAEEGFESPPQTGTLMQVRQWGRRMADMAKNATGKVKEMEARLQDVCHH